jgi:hypothetical protein
MFSLLTLNSLAVSVCPPSVCRLAMSYKLQKLVFHQTVHEFKVKVKPEKPEKADKGAAAASTFVGVVTGDSGVTSTTPSSGEYWGGTFEKKQAKTFSELVFFAPKYGGFTCIALFISPMTSVFGHLVRSLNLP